MKIFMSLLAKATVSLFFLGGLFSCEKENLPMEVSEPLNASINAMNTVKIASTGMNFNAPDEIPSGWNTFKYTNGTNAPHFFLLVKIPTTKSLEDYRTEVTVPFNNWVREMRTNPNALPLIEPWFFTEAINYGGSGLIDPGKTAVTSINLEPGNYIIECYVKMPNGDFHSVHGMLEQLTVTEETTRDKEPKADVTINVKNNGLHLDNEIRRPGMHTFKAEFEGGTNAADVHLVRIDDVGTANVSELNGWMHWINNLGLENEGLMTPAPEGFTFLGGTQELELGGTTYFQAVLKPGTYALISEVPDPEGTGHYYEFSVKPKK